MKPVKVGITGGIGSGKSVVSRILKTMGYPVFDADQTAKDLYLAEPIKNAVIELLGPSAYLKNGKPDKVFIAEKIFNDPLLLTSINNILHPQVNLKFKSWTEVHQNAPVVFKEAAIMFESGSHRSVDLVAGVLADEKTRIERVKIRDQKSEDEIRKIIQRQMNQTELAKMCDYTLVNDDRLPLMPQILSLLSQIQNQENPAI